MNIYLANISFKAKKDDIQELFEGFGEVESVKLITDHETGRSKGFAFVEMPDTDEAKAAINAIHELEFMGRSLVCNAAKPQAKK